MQTARLRIAPPAKSIGPDPDESLVHAAARRYAVCPSEFGSTACKALFQCNDCREPFDYFKNIGPAMSDTGFYELTIAEVKPETDTAIRVTFTPVDLRDKVPFIQGQFLTLKATIDGEGAALYSSAPASTTVICGWASSG